MNLSISVEFEQQEPNDLDDPEGMSLTVQLLGEQDDDDEDDNEFENDEEVNC